MDGAGSAGLAEAMERCRAAIFAEESRRRERVRPSWSILDEDPRAAAAEREERRRRCNDIADMADAAALLKRRGWLDEQAAKVRAEELRPYLDDIGGSIGRRLQAAIEALEA